MASYDQLIESNWKLKNIVSPKSWEFCAKANEKTLEGLVPGWIQNMKRNLKLLDRHGTIADYRGAGFNKAFVGIGSGPSFNLNKEVLRDVACLDGVKDYEDQDFLFAVANHSFKPCLQIGLIPHFAVLCDATETVMDQLTKEIPASGQHTTLIASLHCSHEVLRRWTRQGRKIKFYIGNTDELVEEFKKETKEDPQPFLCHQGGNVLNNLWSIAVNTFHSTTFMATGNDLSYPLSNDLEGRRASYYSDGREAYNQNMANRRDEARSNFAWMGFEFDKNNIVDAKGLQYPVINFKPMGTSHQLWVYKSWIETQVALHENAVKPLHYFNCSEAGILGVVAKDYDVGTYSDKKNWILLDTLLPKRWHTKRLVDAMRTFVGAKEWMRNQRRIDTPGIITGAGYVINSAA